jgi:hypothetical protein
MRVIQLLYQLEAFINVCVLIPQRTTKYTHSYH